MKNLLSLPVLFSLFSLAAFAQNTTPPPTAAEKETDVVKISTTLIQVDVTVTDKKGNPVSDLKPEEIEIYENGEKQDITNFSYVSQAPQNLPVGTDAKLNNKSSVPIPVVKLKPGQARRTYVLLVDDLGLSFASSFWVKSALKKFVNEQMQEGDLVAILRVSGGISALQAFTSDKRQLLAAAEKVRWNGMSRTGVNSYDPISKTLADNIDGTKNADGTVKRVAGLAENKESQQRINADYQENFAFGTIGALNYVIRGMQDLPGRKSLLLFSEGFPMLDRSGRGMPEITRMINALKSVAELANRSSVVIHTLDPRGLTIPGDITQAADDVSSGSDTNLVKRGAMLIDSQNSLRFLAEETGGIPYVDQNDLNQGIQKVLNDQKAYYLIGYQPDSDTFDPRKSKFNKLVVKVKRPGLKIRYRSGFTGVTDEKLRQSSQPPQQRLAAALTSPFGADEININLYSVFYNDAVNRSFIRSFVYIDPKDLTFTLDDDGLYRTKFDLIAMIFDADGRAASNGINSYKLQFTKEQLAKAREKGVIYDLSVPIIKPGGYQSRVALQDTTTGKIGAASQFIEVPNLEKKKLALSNLIVNNYSLGEWKKISLGQVTDSNSRDRILADTTSRQFKRATVFTYSFAVYNAKTNQAASPQLQLQTRLFHNGKLIVEGSPKSISTSGQKDLQRIEVLEAVTLGTDLQPGDYVLQVIVSDNLAKEKQKIAAQSVDFEVVR